MKTRFAHKAFVTLGLAVFPFINGCTQQSNGNASVRVTTSSVAPPVAIVAPASAMPTEQPVPNVANSSQPLTPTPVEAFATAPAVFPENLRISQSLNEVIRLAQSGVDEGVMLTYVTNSSALFALGAEEIIYLNDLGVYSSVIVAMLQHDQNLKAAPTTSAQQIAVAPTYVNPPQPVVVQESQPVNVTENYFNDTLSPYGTWVYVEGYGRCWRPTVAVTSPTWRPYVDRGRWVHTDAGWYWMSDYSWGGVAFHYGRWFSDPGLGWCWWPDNVWGPSWVSWRYNSYNCGWAPLPPLSYYRSGVGFSYWGSSVGYGFDFNLGSSAYTFVQWGRFCDPRPYQYCVPRSQVNVVYNQTTIINNYGDGKNNTAVNRGISADRVREHSRAEVRTANIQAESPRKGEVRAERLERGGNTLVVSRPTSLPPQGGERISASREKGSVRGYPTAPGAPEVMSLQPKTGGSPGILRESKSGRERAVTTPAPINQSVAVTPSTGGRAQETVLQPDTPNRNTREPKIEAKSTDRAQTAQIAVPQTKTTTPATPARTATPIFSRPLVVETVPHIPSRPVVTPQQPSTIVIGDGRNRSGGRDYSAWNSPQQPAQTPQPRTQPGSSVSSSDFNRDSSRHQDLGVSPTQVQSQQSSQPSQSVSRSSFESRHAETLDRQARSRSEGRTQAPFISTPAPAPRPAPTYTPPSAPAARPAAPTYTPPPALRVESRPAPAHPEPARSETGATFRGESKSNSNPSKRDR